MSEPYMTKQDVATYTRMSEKWVQRRAADLGAISLGGRLRFKRSLVDAYVESRSLAPRRRRGGA